MGGAVTRKLRGLILTVSALLLACPAEAALTRTARGTNSLKNASSLTVSVTAAAGSSLIVEALGDATQPIPTVTWNGATWQHDLGFGVTNLGLDIFSAHNVPAGTAQTLSVTWAAANAYIAVIVTEVSGWVGQGVFDQSASASSTSVNADSGLTATTTAATEYLAGGIAVRGSSGDAAPTWLNGFSAGQRVGTTGGPATSNGTQNEGFQIVSATAQYKAAATLGTSRLWVAGITTYKDSGGAAAPLGISKGKKLEAMDP